MTKQKYFLCIVFACLMAISSISVADVADFYGENGKIEPSFSSDSREGLVLSPFIEQSGEVTDSPPLIFMMPITVSITIPYSITVNFICADPSCAELITSSTFETGDLDFVSEYFYTYESDGTELEELLTDADFEEILSLLFAGIFDFEEIDMSEYTDYFDTFSIPDSTSTTPTSTTKTDAGTRSDQHAAYNEYYSNLAKMRQNY